MPTSHPPEVSPRKRPSTGRTDLASCLGEEVVVLLRNPAELKYCLGEVAPPGNSWRATLVGYDDIGVWLEPVHWIEQARRGEAHSVLHILVSWNNVAGLLVDSDRSKPSQLAKWHNGQHDKPAAKTTARKKK
jgi:hypothetical protein